jgi:hypothetical protein
LRASIKQSRQLWERPEISRRRVEIAAESARIREGDNNARKVEAQSPAGDVSRRFIATTRWLAEN